MLQYAFSIQPSLIRGLIFKFELSSWKKHYKKENRIFMEVLEGEYKRDLYILFKEYL